MTRNSKPVRQNKKHMVASHTDSFAKGDYSMPKRLTLCLAMLFGTLGAQVATAELILSAPPRETPEAGMKTYGPLADYLSKASGEKVVYRHPDNWGVYQAHMTKGDYDLVFDGPHFVSWRIDRLQHVPIVALAGQLNYVVVARRDDARVQKVANLAGKGVCGHAPPNLATLTLYDQFSNPSRQPLLVETKGFEAAYAALLTNKCMGTVLPSGIYRKLDTEAKRAKVLFESKPYPNLALTAGKDVSAQVRERIAKALLAVGDKPASHALAESLGGQEFVAVTSEDYRGYGGLLRNVWGFEAR